MNKSSYRENGTILERIDHHFNPFHKTHSNSTNTVFFIYGNKIDKKFYYNHRYPEVELPRMLMLHFQAYFDIVACYGPLYETDGFPALTFLKGRDTYLKLLRGVSNSQTATNSSQKRTGKVSRPGMAELTMRLHEKYNTAVNNGQPQKEAREIYHPNAPDKMIEEFHKRIFPNEDNKVLLILESFQEWASLISDKTSTLYHLKSWCADPGLRKDGHSLMVLTKTNFTAPGAQLTPQLQILNELLATKGNVASIPLHNHTKSDIEKFLTIKSLEKEIPFSIERIPEIATTLSAAVANYVHESENAENDFSANDLSIFDQRTFDITELGDYLISSPDRWQRYYSVAERLAKLQDFGSRLADQIYHPTVIKEMLRWLKGALGTINNSQAKTAKRNIFLYGPGGTGKTSFAEILASEFKFSHIQQEYLGMYIGQSNERIGQIFSTASQLATQRYPSPTLVVLDEFERVVYPENSESNTHSAIQETVTALKDRLVRKEYDGVFTVAAANAKDIGDAALKRRFAAMLLVPLPGPTEIYRYIKRLFPCKNMEKINLEQLALQLYEYGFSFALLDFVADDLSSELDEDDNKQLTSDEINTAVVRRLDQAYDTETRNREGFVEETQRFYPDIFELRDAEKEETEIMALIEETKQFVDQYLRKLQERF